MDFIIKQNVEIGEYLMAIDVDENRITELEIKLSYQEDLLQTLNLIVTEQQKQLYRLEGSIKLLGARMKNMSESEGINQGIEVPPHY